MFFKAENFIYAKKVVERENFHEGRRGQKYRMDMTGWRTEKYNIRKF